MSGNDNKSGSQALMGFGCLCVLIAMVLMFVGPKNDAGHVFWWWYLIVPCGIVLWLAGKKGRGANPAAGEKSIEGWQAELELALSAKDKESEAKSHFNLGVAYQAAYEPPRHGQASDYTPLDRAIEHLSRARDLHKELGNSDGQGLALANLGIVHYARQEDQRAVTYFREAVDIAKSLKSPVWEDQMIQRFSKLLGEMGRTSEAKKVIWEYSIRKRKAIRG